MEETAEILIIGAGIVGCSTAFFLAQQGWQDIVVIEQGALFRGTDTGPFRPGLLFQTNESQTLTKLAQQSIFLYTNLSLRGLSCYYKVGSMELATSSKRWVDLKRKLGLGKAWGVQGAELISPNEVRHRLPLLDSTPILGAYAVADDGVVRVDRAAEALALAARKRGVKFHGNTSVSGFERNPDGSIRAVRTSLRPILPQQVIICNGIWSNQLAAMLGFSLPLVPLLYQYVRTAPLNELATQNRDVSYPIVSDPENMISCRQHDRSYGIGSYPPDPRMLAPEDLKGVKDEEALVTSIPFDDAQFAQAWNTSIIPLMPPLTNVDLNDRLNVPLLMTPDGLPLVGDVPDVPGLWIAEAIDTAHAGGIGSALAEWLTDGSPQLDLRPYQLQRFAKHAQTPTYVRTRSIQHYQALTRIVHPREQTPPPRQVRTSPFYPRQQTLDAVFCEQDGWETPRWYASNSSLPLPELAPNLAGWAGHNWSPLIGAEHHATRQQVALFDLTPLLRCMLAGPDALMFLQYLCTNQIKRPIGKVIYTALANQRGQLVSTIMVTRLANNQFHLGLNSRTDLLWLQQHMPRDGSVRLEETSESMCGLGLWGPHARAVLEKVTDDDVSQKGFPPYTARWISIGALPVLAQRLSLVGELGWELYTPTSYGLALWDRLWLAGRAFQMVAAGSGALESLRVEKGFRRWGIDVTPRHSPFEAGIGHIIRLDQTKGEFLGRSALTQIKRQVMQRRLCCLSLEDPSLVLMGHEPVLLDGNVIGSVTSANIAYTMQESIAYAYLLPHAATIGTDVVVEYFDLPYRARVVAEPVYDPINSNLHG